MYPIFQLHRNMQNKSHPSKDLESMMREHDPENGSSSHRIFDTRCTNQLNESIINRHGSHGVLHRSRNMSQKQHKTHGWKTKMY